MHQDQDEEAGQYPRQLRREQKLRNDVERGRKRLEEALGKVAKIPDPSKLPIKPQQDRLSEIRTVLEKPDRSDLETDGYAGFHVRLFETETIFLFEMTPKYFVNGTEEAESFRKMNEVFKENVKKRSTEKVRCKTEYNQIIQAHTYPELVLTDPVEMKDVACSAAGWILYDAYNQQKSPPKEESAETDSEENCKTRNGDDKIFSEESPMMFRQAAMFTCRVLSSNSYQSQQIQFSKKHQPSRSIAYKMELLWTLAGPKLGTVHQICLNPSNSKVIGVGYGDRDGPGAAKVWHVKNPEAAERELRTRRAVTCLRFSRTQPRLLAAATRGGCVLLIDITAAIAVHSVVNKQELSPHPEPLWSLRWVEQEEGEKLLTVGQDGMLWMWDPLGGQPHTKIAELTFVAGPDPELNVKFQKVLDEPLDSDDEEAGSGDYFVEVPYIGLSICTDGPHKIYVTTDIGAILYVNTKKAGNAWEKIGGHKQAVFGMAHSPYIGSVYLTNSADAEVCIWMHGIQEPLVHLRVSDLDVLSIDSAAWSPSHSSIIASASKEMVCIWDIGRRTDAPMSTLTGRHYTHVCFSESGTNLLVGCDDGDVLVYRLSEMPHRPHLQKEHLEKALRKSLETKPKLLDELEAVLSKL